MAKKRVLRFIASPKRFGNSFDIVFEWENILSKQLSLKILKPNNLKLWFFRQIEVRLKAVDIYHFFVLKKRDLKLRFVMDARIAKSCLLDKNSVPVIIDFWLEKDEYEAFYDVYKHCPLVLITSAEVFHTLKKENCPLNIMHWPLSIPDKELEILNHSIEKEWDLVLLGRTDRYFLRMLEKYCKNNPDFVYVRGNGDIDNRYFETNKGEFVSSGKTREDYLHMMSKAKITFYTTPGLDESKSITTSYNQVTPRFLEFLSRGCYVLARYPNNSDTKFYDLASIAENIDSYKKFELQLNKYLNSESASTLKIKSYLSNHTTTARAINLKKQLNDYLDL